MDDTNKSQLHEYKVTLGHVEVTVTGRDEADALRRARQQLSNELPRLWDRVYMAQETEFRVNEIQ
jgi:hypothetical protein